MALNFDRDVFQRPPMGQFGASLVPQPPQQMMQGGGAKDFAGMTPTPGSFLGKIQAKGANNTGIAGGMQASAMQGGGLGMQSYGGPAPAGLVDGAKGSLLGAGGMLGAKGNPLGPKQIAAAGGAPAAAAPVKAQGGNGSKKPAGPLTGNKLVDSTLEGVLQGKSTSFGPDVINNLVSGALQSREAANRTGLDDVNRQLAARGLGRSGLGAGMAGDVLRSNRQDYSSNISNIYSDKAKQDFADKMGAVSPYQQQIQMKEAAKNAAANRAEQARQFDISQKNRGGGGGGPSEDDMLFKLLMGNQEIF